jgi:hypothetical protein
VERSEAATLLEHPETSDRLSDEADRARNADPYVEANFGEQGKAYPCRAATLDAFVTAARALKQAEDALITAREVYAQAVRAMSTEAVK